jgi:hypothetical protein
LDADRFDALTRSLSALASSRRRLLTGVAGSAVGMVAAALGVPQVEAGHFGCHHVGRGCRRDDECCSSRCKGPKGQKTCRAHGVKGCVRGPVDPNTCESQSGTTCGSGTVACGCSNTTGGSAFCTSGPSCFGPSVTPCTHDKECEERTGKLGAACVECFNCLGGTGCADPCP